MSGIESALTREEWMRNKFYDDPADPHTSVHGPSSACGSVYLMHNSWDNTADFSIERVQALAAMCLYGQDYGFTWEDVDEIRLEARTAGYMGLYAAAFMEDLADRIEALLPPREVAEEMQAGGDR